MIIFTISCIHYKIFREACNALGKYGDHCQYQKPRNHDCTRGLCHLINKEGKELLPKWAKTVMNENGATSTDVRRTGRKHDARLMTKIQIGNRFGAHHDKFPKRRENAKRWDGHLGQPSTTNHLLKLTRRTESSTLSAKYRAMQKAWELQDSEIIKIWKWQWLFGPNRIALNNFVWT